MIRIKKSSQIPSSLLKDNCKKYDGEDVQEALNKDQFGKCYLCEQQTGKDYQIEHFKAKADGIYSELKFSWENLFLACSYCNARKSNDYNNLLEPTLVNIEEVIEQRIDFSTSKIQLKDTLDSPSSQETVRLLDKLLNGNSKIRKTRDQKFYDDIFREITFFINILTEFKQNQTSENKQIVIDSLKMEKEFLALKYWILKDEEWLFHEFSIFIKWNKE